MTDRAAALDEVVRLRAPARGFDLKPTPEIDSYAFHCLHILIIKAVAWADRDSATGALLEVVDAMAEVMADDPSSPSGRGSPATVLAAMDAWIAREQPSPTEQTATTTEVHGHA